MKPIRSILTAGMMLAVFVNTAPALTLPVSEDTSTSATPALARSAGKENTLHVSATRHGLIRFEAGAFAESFATGDISKARLVLFLSRVTSPGALTIHRITEEWSEDGAGTPAYDPTPLATIPRSSVVGKQFVIVDVTPTVKGWLKKPSSDFGFAIVSSGNTNVLLGSKEGPATGYPAQLQIEGGAAITPDANTNDPGTNVLVINSLTGDAATGITVTKMAHKAYVVSSNASAANTANSIVQRDASGNINAGTITGNSFVGPGSGLTSLNAANLTGALPAISGANLTNLNAANLTGTLPSNSVGSNQISDGTVAEGDLTAAVQTKLNALGGSAPTGPAGGSLSGTYPNPGLAANSVGSTQIANGAVTTAKLNLLTGNVGIGTNAPSTKLHVGDFTTISLDNAITVSTNGVNTSAPPADRRASIKLRNFDNTFGITLESVDGVTTSGLDILRHSSSAAGVTAMFIDRGSGNVGVGTRTPGSIFEVATGAQVSSSSGVGFLAVGPTSGVHCAIDSDDIQYFNGNAPTSMFLNYYGGGVNIATGPTANNVTIGRAGTTTTINGTFVNASDRNIKEGFAPVKTQEVLDRLLTMPVSTWSYKGADGERRHIGPMAQDFHAAFNDLLDLKSDDKTIAPLDEAGVAFTAIQGLNEVVKEKDRKIQDLEERLTRLEKMMEAR